jgi:uncharacterized protein (TIGR02246 family)
MTTSTRSDETTIRQLYHDLLNAWNRRSASDYAAFFTSDANLVGFDGSQIDGKAAIDSTLSEIFAHHMTQAYVGKVREVRFLAPDVAMLRAVVGMTPHGKKDLDPSVNAIQSLIAVRVDGAWRIALFQNTPAAFHGRPELAQALTEELQQLL